MNKVLTNNSAIVGGELKQLEVILFDSNHSCGDHEWNKENESQRTPNTGPEYEALQAGEENGVLIEVEPRRFVTSIVAFGGKIPIES